MYISEFVAQTVVEEIGREIRENVNLMDQEGRIIASTDPERIGTLHDGARRVIREGLQELYITPDMETATTRKGINLPIAVRGETVGVIGITGEKERVAGYGNIVRRMTEIMIEDSLLRDKSRYDRRVRYRFMEEWIGKAGAVYDKSFVERGQRLGIDIAKPRRALVIHFARYQVLSDTMEGQRHLEEMEASIRHFADKEKDMLYLREPPRQICLVRTCPDGRMRELAQQIIQLIRRKYRESVLVGIDSGRAGDSQISHNCEEAEAAVGNCREGDREIVFYKELNVELFLDEVDGETMKKYVEKLFPHIDLKELESYMTMIAAYFENDGSVTRMADMLKKKKNTVQYKLKKLETLSGRDIRTPKGAAVYYMALSFYRKLCGSGVLGRNMSL